MRNSLGNGKSPDGQFRPNGRTRRAGPEEPPVETSPIPAASENPTVISAAPYNEALFTFKKNCKIGIVALCLYLTNIV